jgi:hypothetical protein
VNLNGLDDITASTVSTAVHLNTASTHGRVSIGVQAGVPSVTSSRAWDLKQMDNETETWGTGVSIGVDAGQQVGGKIGPGKYCALHLDLGSNITVYGGFYKLLPHRKPVPPGKEPPFRGDCSR